MPGRSCPADYAYAEGALAGAEDGDADVVYAAGNVYGNTEALKAIHHLVEHERGTVKLVFAGDFHWFDIAEDAFAEIADGVAAFDSIAGNVERELVRDNSNAGCGCAYPPYVNQAVVERSNEIMHRLHATASGFQSHRRWLAARPAFRALCMAGERVLLLHGDTCSLAGWHFAAEKMPDTVAPASMQAEIPTSRAWIENEFLRTNARVIACSHTCLPIARRFDVNGDRCLLINNGAAGMPNFRGRLHGVMTRVAVGTAVPPGSLYGVQIGPLRCDAVAVDYDHDAWWACFRKQWQPDSPAYRSYANRIRHGADYTISQAYGSAETEAHVA